MRHDEVHKLSHQNAAAEGNSTIGKLNAMFNSVHRPTDVPWGVRGYLSGEHVMVAPLSAMMLIIHNLFSQVRGAGVFSVPVSRVPDVRKVYVWNFRKKGLCVECSCVRKLCLCVLYLV